MVTLGSDNPFPSLLIVEGVATAPASGRQRAYIDPTTHLLKLVNSSGTQSNVGPPMTLTEYTLSGDVTLTTAGTFYDGPSGTPAAGTYDVEGYACCNHPSALSGLWVARLVSGSTVIDERHVVIGENNVTSVTEIIPLTARVVLDGSTILKMSVTCQDRNTGILKRDPTGSSSAVHRATILTIRKVA